MKLSAEEDEERVGDGGLPSELEETADASEVEDVDTRSLGRCLVGVGVG